jgi:hypothetical protein
MRRGTRGYRRRRSFHGGHEPQCVDNATASVRAVFVADDLRANAPALWLYALVVFVHLAIPLPPAVELTRDALNEPPGADPGLLPSAPDEIHDLVPHVVRYPDPPQISPRLLFKATCSAISSASTSSLIWILPSRYSIRSCFGW